MQGSAPGPHSGSSSSSEAQAPVFSSHAKTAVARWPGREPSSNRVSWRATRSAGGPTGLPTQVERAVEDSNRRPRAYVRLETRNQDATDWKLLHPERHL